jgi:hypothetical protein
VRHHLPVSLAGARSFAAIGEWVADQPETALVGLGGETGGRPTESIIRRVLAHLDADLLDQVISPTFGDPLKAAPGRAVRHFD